jgi:hypothetical protein
MSTQASIPGPAELDHGDQRHRQGHHRRADERNQHRQARPPDTEQRGIVEPHEGEHEGRRADDQNLDELAAHVIGQLAVHLDADLGQHRALAGQQRAEARRAGWRGR